MQRSQNNTNQRNIVYSKKSNYTREASQSYLMFFSREKSFVSFFRVFIFAPSQSGGGINILNIGSSNPYSWCVYGKLLLFRTFGVYTTTTVSVRNNCMRRARKMKKTWPSLSPFYNICLQRTAHTSIWFIWDTQSI